MHIAERRDPVAGRTFHYGSVYVDRDEILRGVFENLRGAIVKAGMRGPAGGIQEGELHLLEARANKMQGTFDVSGSIRFGKGDVRPFCGTMRIDVQIFAEIEE